MATRKGTKAGKARASRQAKRRSEAKGLQKVAAVETSAGSVSAHSGPANRPRIDIAQVQKEEDARVKAATSNKRQVLSDETVSRLGKPELFAIAEQRGYELSRLGTRTMRASFLAAQKKDKLAKKG